MGIFDRFRKEPEYALSRLDYHNCLDKSIELQKREMFSESTKALDEYESRLKMRKERKKIPGCSDFDYYKYMDKAQKLTKQKKYEEAVEHYNLADKIEPDAPGALMAKYKVLRTTHNDDKLGILNYKDALLRTVSLTRQQRNNLAKWWLYYLFNEASFTHIPYSEMPNTEKTDVTFTVDQTEHIRTHLHSPTPSKEIFNMVMVCCDFILKSIPDDHDILALKADALEELEK